MRAQPPVEGVGHRADGDDPAGRFVLGFRTHSTSLADVRRRFGDWLAGVGLDEDAAYDLLVAVSEAASNAIEHAYPPEIDGTVQVSADVERDGTVCAVISDHGQWRVPPTALSHRGRGLLLMRENVDQVMVDRGVGGTTVTLCQTSRTKRVGSVSPRLRPHGHEVLVEERDAWVHVAVRGDVPADAGATLRRSLLTAARGGSVPVVVDLAGLGSETAGAVHAVFAVADAASAAGNRLVVLAHPGSPTWAALASSGVRHVADVVSPIG